MLVTPPLSQAQLAAMALLLTGPGVPVRALWRITSADMNSTADQAMTKIGTFSTFLLFGLRGQLTNASTSLTTAVGGIYTAAAKAGTAVVAASQTYAAANGANTGCIMTVAPAGGVVLSATELYLSLTVAQGATATADIYLLGIPLS